MPEKCEDCGRFMERLRHVEINGKPVYWCFHCHPPNDPNDNPWRKLEASV